MLLPSRRRTKAVPRCRRKWRARRAPFVSGGRVGGSSYCPSVAADEERGLAERLLDAVRSAATVPVPGDDEKALSDCDALLDALAQLQAVVADRLLDLDRRDAADLAGYPSVTAWARARTGADPREVARLLRLARAASRHAATGALWRSGRVSAAHLDTVADAVRGLDASLASAGDAFLAVQAPQFSPAEFLRIGQAWRDTVVPDVATEEREAADDAQHLTVSPTTGGAVVRGWLTGTNAAWVVAALDRFAAPVPHDQRSAARRRADALGLAARIATAADDAACAEAGAPGGLPSASVTVIADPVTLQRALDAVAADGRVDGCTGGRAADVARWPAWQPVGPRDLTRPPVDERTGAPLATAELMALVCDGRLGRALLDAPAESVDLGVRVRLFSTAQRRALARGTRPACSWRRCRSPWVEAHHHTPWSAGGATDLANGRLLCRYHHSLVHLGWQLTDSGRPLAPPDWDLIRRRPTRLRRQRGTPV